MRCGTKCFLVEVEVNGEVERKSVIARSQVEARKTIRTKFGADAQIVSVVEDKRKR